MRKGDRTRQTLLNAAEQLFCRKGYGETSVQDILDAVHGSKGGFYHHFESKDEVLRQLCAARAEASADAAREALRDAASPMARINLVLRYAMPLRSEELDFMSMLMPLLDRPESVSVRVCYQDAILDAFRPLLRAELLSANAAGITHPVAEDAPEAALTLINACWFRLALILLAAMRKHQKAEPALLLEALTSCRKCVEALLDTPYAAVELISLQRLDDFSIQLLSRAPER